MRLFGWKPPDLPRLRRPARAPDAPVAKPRPEIGEPTHPRRWGLPPISFPSNPRPFGVPDPNAGAKGPLPVGPNYWLAAGGKDPAVPRGISPNYPLEFNYAVDGHGKYGPPTVVSGPSLLPPEHRVPGPVDYDRTADAIHRPHPGLPGVSVHGEGGLFTYSPGGLPPARDGRPALPLDPRYGARPPAEAPSAANPWGLPGPDMDLPASRPGTPRYRGEPEASSPPESPPPPVSPFHGPERRRSSGLGPLADSGYASLPGDKPLE